MSFAFDMVKCLYMAIPRHHVLFTRKTWESQESTKELRRNQWLMPPMKPGPHREAHAAIATVPVLDHFTAMRVLKDFVPIKGNYVQTMGELALCIDDAIHHPKAREIERGIGELVIASLEIQMPIVKRGAIYP